MSIAENPDFDEALKQYYQILRCRQSQIIGIIKETSEFVESFDANPNKEGFDKNSERRTKLAFSMINALAGLLDEQMNALNIWERILSVQHAPVPPPSGKRCCSPKDFEIAMS